MSRFLIIPDRENFEETLKLCDEYNLKLELNDFMHPRVLDDVEKCSEITQFYGEYENLVATSHGDFYDVLVQFQYKGALFDRIFFVDPFASEASIIALADGLKGVLTPQKAEADILQNVLNESETPMVQSDDELFAYESPLAKGWTAIISQKIPCKGQHIGRLVSSQILTPETLGSFAPILDKMEAAEAAAAQYRGKK